MDKECEKLLLVGLALLVGADLMHQDDALCLEKDEDIVRVSSIFIDMIKDPVNKNKSSAELAREIRVKFYS